MGRTSGSVIVSSCARDTALGLVLILKISLLLQSTAGRPYISSIKIELPCALRGEREGVCTRGTRGTGHRGVSDGPEHDSFFWSQFYVESWCD